MEKTSKRNLISTAIAGTALFVLCLLSLYFGAVNMSAEQFFSALSDIKRETSNGIIIYSVRLPRLLASLVAGAGLGMSGAILQTVTQNKMASPNLIGVNSGAGFAVILSLSFFPHLFRFVPLFAFVGAFLSTVFITAISRKAGMSKSNIILVGLAFSSVLSAGISLISLVDSDALVSYNSFSIGTLSGVETGDLLVPAITILIVLLLAEFFSSQLDILSLGDTTANSLGVSVNFIRTLSLVLASAAASSVVSFAGLLGFVGLMSPHISRKFVSEKTRVLLPFSALVGAILVTLSDLLGRILFAPSEIPVGIIMALAGAPFFLCLLIFKGGGKDA